MPSVQDADEAREPLSLVVEESRPCVLEQIRRVRHRQECFGRHVGPSFAASSRGDRIEAGLEPGESARSAMRRLVGRGEHDLASEASRRQSPPRRADRCQGSCRIALREQQPRDRVGAQEIVLERRQAVPWQRTGWEEQATPSESVDGGVLEPWQEVIYIALAHGVRRQLQHDLLASVGRSPTVPVAIAYEVMPDVVERLCLAQGQPRVVGSREQVDDDWSAQQLTSARVVDESPKNRNMRGRGRELFVVEPWNHVFAARWRRTSSTGWRRRHPRSRQQR